MKAIDIYGATDIGCQRTKNDDNFILTTFPENGKYILGVAIDGCGGYFGGSVAAEIAQRTISTCVQDTPMPNKLNLLKAAIIEANNSIMDMQYGELCHMCCVLTAVLYDSDTRKAYMGHVGDSRLYLWADECLRKLSHDHSEIGYMEENGTISEDEAMHNPFRSLIYRALGMERLTWFDDYIELAEFDIPGGSTLLACSDGVHDMLTSAQISYVLGRHDISAKEKVEVILRMANDAGGKDNITAVVIDINE